MIRKIAIKTAILFLLLVLMNEVYRRWFFESDLQQHSPVINLVKQVPVKSDILHVGESSNLTYRDDDFDKRPISEMLGDFYPGLVVSDITKPAAHAGIYKVLLQQVPDSASVSTVVVTCNLRSFNAEWIYSKLETALQKSMVLLHPGPPLFNRFLLSFKAYDIRSDKEREQQVLHALRNETFDEYAGVPYKNTLEWKDAVAPKWRSASNVDEATAILAGQYVITYGFQIDTLRNPRIRDFEDIIKLGKKRGWNVVLNIMAENTQKAGELAGEELVGLIRKNVRLLEEYYTRRGALVVNNLDMVADSCFIDRNWTTEHYTAPGRWKVAQNLASHLKKLYPEAYFDAQPVQPRPEAHFFNDFEGLSWWGRNETISTQTAWSGTHSSIVSKEKPYSAGLVLMGLWIPDTTRSKVRISFMYRILGNPVEATVVFEVSDGSNYKWQGVPLDKKEPGEWEPYTAVMSFPFDPGKVGKIKVYVYNPATAAVAVDDMEILFY